MYAGDDKSTVARRREYSVVEMSMSRVSLYRGPYQRPDVMGGNQAVTPKIYELNNVVSQLLQAERKVSPSHK